MASVYDYKFDNITRNSEDLMTLSEKNRQNNHFGSYSVMNYFKHEIATNEPTSFATLQPNIFVNGGKNTVGINGSVVDFDSQLKIDTTQTNPKSRISLFQRPFITVPYLGRGPARIEDESILQQGDMISKKKTSTELSESSYIDYQQYPLIDSIRSTVSNPKHLVEGAADSTWIRGGSASRDDLKQ